MSRIHPTAVIAPGAQVADEVTIGPNCVLDADVRIDAGCRLYQNVYVTGWTTIGEACVLHPNVIVGHEPQDVKYKGARTYCRIGRETILRENVTVHRGTDPESATVIGERCFLLAGAHVGHNCTIGNGVTLINNVLLGGHVQVGDGATLGGGAGVHQFVRIGALCMVAGVARVVKDVPPFVLTDGMGRVAGLNRIGLRRAGLSRDDVAALRNAFRMLYADGVGFRDAVARLVSTSPSGACAQLVQFLTADSRRGIAGRSRGGAPVGASEADGD